jgi:elongation factor Ts
MNQEFIKDNKMSIRQYLESKDKNLKATGFVRYTLNV